MPSRTEQFAAIEMMVVGLSLEREKTKQAQKLFRENCIFLHHNNNKEP
jgi:hypothetical protein